VEDLRVVMINSLGLTGAELRLSLYTVLHIETTAAQAGIALYNRTHGYSSWRRQSSEILLCPLTYQVYPRLACLMHLVLVHLLRA